MASAGERILVRMLQTYSRMLLGRQAYRVIAALGALHGSTTAPRRPMRASVVVHAGSRQERLQQAPTRPGVLAMLYVPEGVDPESLLRTSRSRFTGH
jgi:hypothetical protein